MTIWQLLKNLYLIVDFVLLKLLSSKIISWSSALLIYALLVNGFITGSLKIPFTNTAFTYELIAIMGLICLFIFPFFVPISIAKRYPKGLKYAFKSHKTGVKRHKNTQNRAVKVVVKPQQTVTIQAAISRLPPHLHKLLADGDG